jgi:protein SCO1/2
MRLLLIAALLAAGSTLARAQQPALDAAAALRAGEAVVGQPVGDHALLDRQGRPVRLSSYRGKPLLVSFIYTGCFQVCPASTRELQEAVLAMQTLVGPDRFNIVSIGFNPPADSPQAMRAFAAQHRVEAPNWEFLSPPAAGVDALTREFGFSHVATPAGFDHLLAVTIVDAGGRIHAQVYGDRLTPDRIGEPLRGLLRDAPAGTRQPLAELIERVRVLCTVYDPASGRYRYDWGLVLEIAGGATFIAAMAWFFLAEWWARRRSRRLDRTAPAGAAQVQR